MAMQVIVMINNKLYVIFCSIRLCLEVVREHYKFYHLWLMSFQKLV